MHACPATEAYRTTILEKHGLTGLDFARLPRSLQLGIPPALWPDHETTFWGDAPHVLEGAPMHIKQLVGLEYQHCQSRKIEPLVQGYINVMNEAIHIFLWNFYIEKVIFVD